jgi:hypothetical protein
VQDVSVFVASHHGRESGCCTELFELFRPQLVIISDDGRQYDSQDTDDWYRTRCAGAVFVANERRYVATTRKDGAMRIDVTADGRWTIQRVTEAAEAQGGPPGREDEVPDTPGVVAAPEEQARWGSLRPIPSAAHLRRACTKSSA